jgi:hypothetical protein
MLLSHKLARWLVPVALPLALPAGVVLADRYPVLALPMAMVAGALVGLAAVSWLWPGGRPPGWIAVPGYLIWGLVAGLHAWLRAARGDLTPTWEPTRRHLPREAGG